MNKIREILSVGGSKGLVINGININEYIKEQVKKEIDKCIASEIRWYDNIPEQGFLCWITPRNPNHKRYVTHIVNKNEFDEYDETEITLLTNEDIEAFKR